MGKKTLQFAQETGIHGLLPFLVAPSKCEKAAWFLILLVAVLYLVKGITFTVWEYMYQPTMTQVTFEVPPAFPEILACDQYWVSEEKIKARGWGVEEYQALGTLFLSHQFFTEGVTGPGKLMDAGNETVNSIILSIAHDVHSYMNGTWPEMNYTMITTLHGPCIHLTNNLTSEEHPLDALYAEWIKVYTMIYRKPGAFGMYNFFGESIHIYVGEDLDTYYPVGSLPVGRKKTTELKIKALKLKHIKNCESDPEYNYGNCKVGALNEFCAKLGKKPYYIGQPELKLQDAGTYIRPESMCDIYNSVLDGKRMTEYIENACKHPCEEWGYDLTANPVDDSKWEADLLGFSFLSPTRSLFIEESFTITGDTFLSNLGGQISLWSGASIVTVVHICVFCCCKRRYKTDGEPQEDTDEIAVICTKK